MQLQSLHIFLGVLLSLFRRMHWRSFGSPQSTPGSKGGDRSARQGPFRARFLSLNEPYGDGFTHRFPEYGFHLKLDSLTQTGYGRRLVARQREDAELAEFAS